MINAKKGTVLNWEKGRKKGLSLSAADKLASGLSQPQVGLAMAMGQRWRTKDRL
jgi:hypothetical protein